MGAKVGRLPTVALANLTPNAVAYRISSGDGWAPLWSIEVLLDLGFTPFLAAAAFAWLARHCRLVGALIPLA